MNEKSQPSSHSPTFAVFPRRPAAPRHAARVSDDNAPHLDAETEADLVTRWQAEEDGKSLDQIVRSFQGLVQRIARQYIRSGLPVADLVSEGNVGLIQAINRFDRTRGFRLSTYATWWIRAGITDFVINGSAMVRGVTTENHKRLFFNLQRLKKKHGVRDSRDLAPDAVAAIAAELDVSESDVLRVNQWFSRKEVSIDAPLRPGDDAAGAWQNVLADPASNQETAMMRRDENQKRKELIRDALDCLNTRERRIVLERHLVEQPRKLADLGDEFGISRERVRQIETRAMDKLRKRVHRIMQESRNTGKALAA